MPTTASAAKPQRQRLRGDKAPGALERVRRHSAVHKRPDWFSPGAFHLQQERPDTMTAQSAERTRNEPPILIEEPEPYICRLVLNRPEKYNALSVEMLRALHDALSRVAAEGRARVVVLAAAGKAFCAGHDLRELRAGAEEDVAAIFRQCSEVMLTIARIPQPVIARVHGTATAAGCQLVAACDLAVAAENARFAVSGVNLGLFCSTPMVALSRNLPRKQALELLLTGSFVDAATARHYGLVNQVVAVDALDESVSELARAIAAKSPAAVAFGKRLFYRQLEAGIEEAYRLANETMTCNLLAEDAQAGIDAFLDKRPLPEWKGR
jgi:enoyl-CoA hydratase/carnithine racemase